MSSKSKIGSLTTQTRMGFRGRKTLIMGKEDVASQTVLNLIVNWVNGQNA